MLMMSLYKTYRFCIKYTLRDYLQQRRRRKYLQQSHESDEMDIKEHSPQYDRKPRNRNRNQYSTENHDH